MLPLPIYFLLLTEKTEESSRIVTTSVRRMTEKGQNANPFYRHSARSLLFGVPPNIDYMIYMRICAGYLFPTL